MTMMLMVLVMTVMTIWRSGTESREVGPSSSSITIVATVVVDTVP